MMQMKSHSQDCAFKLLAVRCSLVLFLFVVCITQRSDAQSVSVHRALYLLSANVGEPAQDSDAAPVVLYKVSSDGQLASSFTVLHGVELRDGMRHRIPAGVYSVHEVGSYLLVSYPYEFPTSTIFIAEEDPVDPHSLDFNSKDYSQSAGDHNATKNAEGAVCDLWVLVAGENGVPNPKTTTLRSACIKPNASPFLEKDQWAEYKYPSLDGSVRTGEVWYLSNVAGKIVQMIWGGPTIEITDAPTTVPNPSGTRSVDLEAASEKFLVVSVAREYGLDRNTDVFVQTRSKNAWKRLPVPPIRTTGSDQMFYRLFDDWLVTSASAALLKANDVAGTVVPNVLTVVETGKQRNDLGIEVEPRTAPDVAKLPARRITLWNLADGRRIDLAVPEDDSEVVHIFDDHQVLLRIHDKLFFAEIQGSKLADYKLVVFDSAVPQVHWAFYSPQ